MSEFKATVGPWIVEDGEYVMDEDGNCIAAFGGIRATDKDEANANLCAAAPELLEALQWLQMALASGTSMDIRIGQEKAETAIAKALGQ